MGFFLSAATLILTIRAEHGISRRLCVWGSSLAIIFWCLINLAAREILYIHSVAQQ